MDSKTIKMTENSISDRISGLPSNIIECILDRLPIRDAVATSILSKEWRHKWTRIPNLVFDKEFFEHIIGYRSRRDITAPYEFSKIKIISKILLLHVGPIHRFVLSIPFLHDNFHEDLISWTHFISRKDVKELQIQLLPVRIKLPSYIFNCSELQSLKINGLGLDLHPPQDFGGFCNLRRLDLFGDLLNGTQISDLVSKCPLLERLSLSCVADGDSLIIDAPRLICLHHECSLASFLKLKNVPILTTISLLFAPLGTMKFCELFDIFGSLPNVRDVTIWALRTINDIPRDAPTNLPTTLHFHKSLTLLEIDISSPQFIIFILCIFKSSPNLRKLSIRVGGSQIHPSAYIREEAALHFLNTQIGQPQTLNNLLTVKIKGLSGSKVEIMFIKLILSCSTVLKTLHLCGARNLQNQAEFTLISELLQCPRPSCQAQVIYSKHPGDSSIFNF